MSDGDARPFRARNGIPCGLIAIMESDGHVIESACRLRFPLRAPLGPAGRPEPRCDLGAPENKGRRLFATG